MALGAANAAPAAPAEETAAQIMRHAGGARPVVLGEYHGTAETPRLVADLVERYSHDGTTVRLALELPMSENVALACYLRSDGDLDARETLRTSPFWFVKDDQHDGRRSRDMLDLIEAIRSLRAQGRDVGVAGYDVETGSSTDNDMRDAAMATHLRQQFNALSHGTRMLVLTGNVHAMRTPPADAAANDGLIPAGSVALQRAPGGVARPFLGLPAAMPRATVDRACATSRRSRQWRESTVRPVGLSTGTQCRPTG
jgi:erythromycin esterase-like protein